MGIETTREDLLARMAKRDPEALGDLYDQIAPRLLGMALRILEQREAAEEVVQETFLKAWNIASALHQEQRSVAAWLVVMTRHAAVARLRAGRSQITSEPAESPASREAPRAKPAAKKHHASRPRAVQTFASSFLESSPGAWTPRPEEIAHLDERLDLLHRVLSELPKPQHRALELAVFGGLTEEEIAQEFGEPLGKVKTAMRAAITFLRHRRRAVMGTWAANL